ncbi:MAG: hypothetical protein H0V29_00025 [Thermoleophilaceae bacterium]|nr:hypothetical protein [Thermoleophilaceae bacterium]
MPTLRQEDGSVIVLALMVSLVILLLGLSTLAVVDTQSRQSGSERVRESAFNLAEGALSAQTFAIGRNGAGTLAQPFPETCDSSTTALGRCPDAATLQSSFAVADQSDYKPSQVSWSTVVRDNPAGDYYDPTVASERYDANKDKRVFVRATATVRGKSRTVVALVALQEQGLSFPRFAISANAFTISNAGNKTIIDGTSSGGVELRCANETPLSCLSLSRPAQITGVVTQNSGGATKAITQGDLDLLVEFASASGTHYPGCPSDYSGKVVVIDSGNCTMNPAAGQTCCNSPSSPGLLIVLNGTLKVLGNTQFQGIIYMANQTNLSGTVLETGGTSLITGGVAIDGPGRLVAGASSLNIKFGPQAFDDVAVAGTAGVVQNTFRELY